MLVTFSNKATTHVFHAQLISSRPFRGITRRASIALFIQRQLQRLQQFVFAQEGTIAMSKVIVHLASSVLLKTKQVTRRIAILARYFQQQIMNPRYLSMIANAFRDIISHQRTTLARHVHGILLNQKSVIQIHARRVPSIR